MKKIIYLLLILPILITSCSNDDDDKEGENENNGKTSFNIRSENGVLSDVSILYKKNGEFIEVADMTSISQGYIKKIDLNDNLIKEIYIKHIFQDKSYLVDTVFIIQENTDNKFVIKKGTNLYINLD